MEITLDSKEKSRESVRRWYARHREEYAALRKKRYAANAALRKKARADAAEYRTLRRKGKKVTRVLTRELNGVTVNVYTSGYVADKLKCSQQVIRNWESKGWIPKPLFPGKHRLYTTHQIALLKMLVETLKKSAHGLRAAQYQSANIDALVEVIHKSWGAEYGSQDANSGGKY